MTVVGLFEITPTSSSLTNRHQACDLVSMPKRKSKSLDTVQNARRVVLESVDATDEAPETAKPSRSLVSQVMAEMGRKGGKIGGKRRLETLSDKRRSQIAKQAAQARWGKKKKHVA
jgi:hypothetical protein